MTDRGADVNARPAPGVGYKAASTPAVQTDNLAFIMDALR